MTELKPCPFCGGKATIGAPNLHKKINIFCKDCGTSTKYTSNDEAIEAWNRRVSE